MFKSDQNFKKIRWVLKPNCVRNIIFRKILIFYEYFRKAYKQAGYSFL